MTKKNKKLSWLVVAAVVMAVNSVWCAQQPSRILYEIRVLPLQCSDDNEIANVFLGQEENKKMNLFSGPVNKKDNGNSLVAAGREFWKEGRFEQICGWDQHETAEFIKNNVKGYVIIATDNSRNKTLKYTYSVIYLLDMKKNISNKWFSGFNSSYEALESEFNSLKQIEEQLNRSIIDTGDLLSKKGKMKNDIPKINKTEEEWSAIEQQNKGARQQKLRLIDLSVLLKKDALVGVLWSDLQNKITDNSMLFPTEISSYEKVPRDGKGIKLQDILIVILKGMNNKNKFECNRERFPFGVFIFGTQTKNGTNYTPLVLSQEDKEKLNANVLSHLFPKKVTDKRQQFFSANLIYLCPIIIALYFFPYHWLKKCY